MVTSRPSMSGVHASTSESVKESACPAIIFAVSPIQLGPLPKAPPRIESTKGRKRGRKAIVNDSPVKHAWKSKQRKREWVKDKHWERERGRVQKKERGRGEKLKSLHLTVKQMKGEFCVICAETFTSSKSRVQWIKCASCCMWTHELCTPGLGIFYCPNCSSDSISFVYRSIARTLFLYLLISMTF
ncbi:tigger transposable element-derived protein [Plakobranchus ocellatus]|uniref:Tigger transposable element-derived protein n=1 Tax=Plakobranchus ocellatus TaxID=259542 RepID=A0AAV4ALD8_9GAST|nr:tigger transposable element-derived protein [Plakobranchus ocellatus]